jgi:hypothetical protein
MAAAAAADGGCGGKTTSTQCADGFLNSQCYNLPIPAHRPSGPQSRCFVWLKESCKRNDYNYHHIIYKI